MKKWVIILIVSVLWGCGSQRSYRKIKRHWYKIQVELQKYPELIDSLEITDRDTIFIKGINDTIRVSSNSPDTWDDSFREKVDSAARYVLLDSFTRVATTRYVDAATNLQKIICPKIEKDTTFLIEVSNSRITRSISVNLRIKALGGKITLIIDSPKITIPDDRINTEVNFKAPNTAFYANPWFWGFAGLGILLIILGVWRLLK